MLYALFDRRLSIKMMRPKVFICLTLPFGLFSALATIPIKSVEEHDNLDRNSELVPTDANDAPPVIPGKQATQEPDPFASPICTSKLDSHLG